MCSVEERSGEIKARPGVAAPRPQYVLKSVGSDEIWQIWQIGPTGQTRNGTLYDAHGARSDLISYAIHNIPWFIGNLMRALREANAHRRAYNELVEMIGSCTCDPF